MTLYFQIIGSGNARYVFNNAVSFGGKYIYIGKTESPKYNTLCTNMIEKLVQDVALKTGSLIAAFVIFGSSPLYEIVVHHSRATFLCMELPFLDKDSDVVYALNLTIQICMAMVGMIGMVCIEIGACLTMNSGIAITEIIKLDADELETEINLNGMSSNVELRLRYIVMKVLDYYQ